MDDREFNSYLVKIALSHREGEAIQFLAKIMQNRIEHQEKQLDEKIAIIQAIKKINKGKNKDIDSLCDNI